MRLVIGSEIQMISAGIAEVRLLRVAVPTKIGHNNVEVTRQFIDYLVPFPPEARPSMKQQERRPAALTYKVNPYVGQLHLVMLKLLWTPDAHLATSQSCTCRDSAHLLRGNSGSRVRK